MAVTDETSSPAAPPVAKGKRTMRQRQLTLSPCSTISTCSSMENSVISTEELEERDKYMANCLILLAAGHSVSTQLETAAVVSEKTTDGKCGGGMYLYECKTCSKCFPSFQALGGHRTSHKKSKPTLITTVLDEELTQLSMNSFSEVRKLTRVHECSICGSEFASGQALGGHMRRHRPVILHDQGETKKERTNIVLSLDLNLPAPMEDYSCSQEDLPASYADDGG